MTVAQPQNSFEQSAQIVFALRQAGIRDKKVLDAMEATPRHLFVDGIFKERAGEDAALPISCGQTISQPSIVGRMTEALELSPRHTVLEIGTGSGYQAAILGKLAKRVYSIERHRPLARQAVAVLRGLGRDTVSVLAADGTIGLPSHAPFDRILLTAAAEDPPPELLDQLSIGGIMVLPVGQTDHVQQLLKIVKTEDDLVYTELGDVRFVPLVEGLADDMIAR